MLSKRRDRRVLTAIERSTLLEQAEVLAARIRREEAMGERPDDTEPERLKAIGWTTEMEHHVRAKALAELSGVRDGKPDPELRLVPCPCCSLPPDVICGRSSGSTTVGCPRCELGMYAKDKESAVECWNHFVNGHR